MPTTTPISQQPKRGIELPVRQNTRKIRTTHIGRWRAAVLILVHVLIAIHIAHWWNTGRTVSPLEPSEAMQFAKSGIINAGFIFFALAIASTLLLGRWFCGWGCHLVAVQDLSRWILEKFRIRPKPIRSSVLLTVPLIAFIYMFIAPALYPTAMSLTGVDASAHSWQQTSLKLTTDSFWATFPSWVPAILTMVICGAIIIYVLGAKGFCTVGCPYGAAFGFVDRYAPMRVRANDNCTGNGHCTAVCTSNVRVHEEVRDFKMVVDPGCMKCLDCVMVCPNDALFIGVGVPAALAGRVDSPRAAAAAQKAAAAANIENRSTLVWLLLVPFIFLAYLVFHGFDFPERYRLGAGDFIYAGMLTVITLAVMLVARRKSRRPREHTLGEECLMAGIFLVCMLCFRGQFVPYLFALGLSAMIALLGTQMLLLLSRRQVGVLGIRLKREGRLQPAAAGYLAMMAGIIALAAYGGVGHVRDTLGRWAAFDAIRGVGSAFETPEAADRAIAAYAAVLRYEPRDVAYLHKLGLAYTVRGRYQEAFDTLNQGLAIDDHYAPLHQALGVLYAVNGDLPSAAKAFERAAAVQPTFAPAYAALGDAYAQLGRFDEAIRNYRRTIELDSSGAATARVSLTLVLLRVGRIEEAAEQVNELQRLAPNDPVVRDLADEIAHQRATIRKP